MSEQLKESLSAVMDGEADEFEIRRVLNETAGDAELRGVWERYHLARSVIRGEGRMIDAGKLGRGLWAEIDASEASPVDVAAAVLDAQVGSRISRVTWGQRIAGVAVAAGVAAAVVVGFGGSEVETASVAPQVARVQQSDVQTAPAALVADEARSAVVDPSASDLQRAQAYMLHHAAHQIALTNQARAVPFVKVAAFESR
jgi:sigma-E factor negative regulatory protein RseA